MLYFALRVDDRQEELLASQIANLRLFHPTCRIGLYLADESLHKMLHKRAFVFPDAEGVEVCPFSTPLRKEQHARFLYDMMYWLEQKGERYDELVALEAQVLFVKKGYEDYVHRQMRGCDYLFASPFQAVQVYSHEQVRRLLQKVNPAEIDNLEATALGETLQAKLFASFFAAAGGTYRFDPVYPVYPAYPATQETAAPADRSTEAPSHPVGLAEVQLAQTERDRYWVYPVADDPSDPVRLWLTRVTDSRPCSLTVMWGCYQGGMEAALQYRLRKLNEWGFPSHAYFYMGGAGLPNFNDIPYAFSPHKKDLGAYLQAHPFDCVTFVNSLYNIEQLDLVGFQGQVFFEMHGYEEGIVKELKRINDRAEGGRIVAVFVPSEHVASIAKAHLPNRPELPIVVVRNTLDTNVFRKRSGADWMIGHYPKLAPWAKDPLLGFVGRLDANKNWSLLLDVFRKVKSKHRDLRLLVASDLTASPELKDFYRRLFEYDLFEDCYLIGNLPFLKMPHFYSMIARSGGVLLSTSHSEGYPYHLLEAGACECPVVCTQIGGSLEIVEHGVNGFTFPIKYDNRAAHLVLELLRDRDLRKQMTAKGRERILLQNDIERGVMQYAAWLCKQQKKHPRV